MWFFLEYSIIEIADFLRSSICDIIDIMLY